MGAARAKPLHTEKQMCPRCGKEPETHGQDAVVEYAEGRMQTDELGQAVTVVMDRERKDIYKKMEDMNHHLEHQLTAVTDALGHAIDQLKKQEERSENRIKELKVLEVDRTSCTTFLSNQLRILMTSVAYVLYQELRWRLRHTKAARSQVGRLQVMLMKIGTRVVESVRRIVLHFPSGHPWQDLWRKASIAVGAAPA